MEDNTLRDSMNTLMKGLDGMVTSLDNTVKTTFKNMGDEHAVAFAKAMADNNIPEKVEHIHKEVAAIKDGFKF